MKTSEIHKKEAPKSVRFAFVTISTSRYHALRIGEEFEDISFNIAKEVITSTGHQLTRYVLIPDSPRLLLATALNLIEDKDVDAIIFSGGTGPTPDDITVQTLRPLFDKELEGFGDVFRGISFQEAGSSSFLSNATAGLVAGKVFFLLPGSPTAVETALRKLICPEAGHIIALARRKL